MLPCRIYSSLAFFCILAFLDQLLAIPYPHPLHVFARRFLGSPIAEYVYIHLHLISEVGWVDGKEIKLPLFRFGGVGGTPPTLLRHSTEALPSSPSSPS